MNVSAQLYQLQEGAMPCGNSVRYGVRKNPVVLLGLELRKVKGSSFWWMALGMMFLISAWSGTAFMKRAGSGNRTLQTMTLAVGEVYQTVSLLAPILAALLTSRLAVLETNERMNLKWLSLGQTDTSRFIAKLALSGTILAACFVVPLIWVPLVAQVKGFQESTSLGAVIVVPTLIVFFSSMAVAAVQLMFSLTLSKQAVGLGIGVIAGLIGSGLGPMNVARLGWLFPAGVSSAASPFLTTATADDYAQMSLVDNPWGLIGASLVACIIWIGVSVVVIKEREARR